MDNHQRLLETIKDQANQEIHMIEGFYQRIVDNAKRHQQIAINQLTDIQERLDRLKDDASLLRHRMLYHEEEVVVNRQNVIASTEQKVHLENLEILHFDHQQLPETIHAIDYLAQTLKQFRVDFVDLYGRVQTNNLLSNEELFEYFLDKSARVEMILSKHNQTVYDAILTLNSQVTEMDETLTNLLKEKTNKINRINQTFEIESRHYVDNQLIFNAEEDSTSIAIQALSSDKYNQFMTFQKHQNEQHNQLVKQWQTEYHTLRNQLIKDYLDQVLVEGSLSSTLFDSMEHSISEREAKIKTLSPKKDSKQIALLHRELYALEKYPHYLHKAQKQANSRLKSQRKRIMNMMKYSALSTLEAIHQLKQSADEYQALLAIDPFLAQAIGDQSSLMMKDYKTQIELLRMNSELKTNIDYDIQMVKQKQDINLLEHQLSGLIKETMLRQEQEILQEILTIHPTILNRSKKLFLEKKQLSYERLNLERLVQNASFHLEILLEQNSLHRQHLVNLTEKLIQHIRQSESHEIYIADAKSELEYMLKQYDMKALYFKTLYENELSYLVIQQSRSEEGMKSHYDFILTTLLNQMRFSEEQIKLAHYEYRSRLESFLHVLEEQKSTHQAQLEQLYHNYDSKIKRLEEDYQATLYATNHLYNEIHDRKQKNALDKTLSQAKSEYEKKRSVLDKAYQEHPLVVESQSRYEIFDQQTTKAIQDAEKLRDMTVSVYSEMYHKAKDRYDALKPYVDQNINVMDPVFFDHLELIKQNYKTALGEAELDLQELIGPHLQHYLEVYFLDEMKPQAIDFQSLTTTFQAEKATLESKYEQLIKQMDEAFFNKLKSMEQSYQTQIDQIDQMIPLVDSRHQALCQEYEKAIDLLKKEQLDKQQKKSSLSLKQISSLTKEYEKALKEHSQVAYRMKNEFEQVVKKYQPYLTFQEKHTHYSKTLRRVRRLSHHEKQQEAKQLLHYYKKFDL